MSVSPERFNEAPITTEQSVGGAEDPITLTSVYELLNRYVQKVDGLQKELADTKSSLGSEIVLLTKRVQELEDQLGQQKKRKVVFDADEVHEDRHLDSLEFLAEVAQQTHVSSSNAVESSKQKEPIQFRRRKSRQYLKKDFTKSTKVPSVDDVQANEPVSIKNV